MKLFLKKFLAAVLALTMVLGVFPLSVFAEGANAADTSSTGNTGSSSLSESGNAVTTVGGPSVVSEEGTTTGSGEIPVTKDIAKLITGMVFTGAVSPEYKNGTYYVKAGETYKVQVTFKERDRVTDSQGNITTEGLEFDMSDTVYFEVSGDKPGLVTMRRGSGQVDVSVTDSDTGAVYHIYHDFTVDANKVTIDWNESNPHFAELRDAHSVVFYFNLDVTFNGSGYEYVQVGDQQVTIYIDDRGKAVITKEITPSTLTLTEAEKQAMKFRLLMQESDGSWVPAKYRDDDGNLQDVPNFTYDQFETDQGNNTQSFTVDNLEPGKMYRVEEVSRPNVIGSYVFDSNQSTTEDEEALSAGGVANMALTNDYEPAKGNIEITKSVTWNDGTGTPSTEVPADQITNIWFAVYDSSNKKVGDYNLSQFTYDEQAKVYKLTIPNLALGTYTVQEQNNINGYTWTATVNGQSATPVTYRVSDSVTLDADGETEGISFGNNYKKMLGDLTIKKTSNGTTTPANTKFTVKNSAGTVVKTFTYSEMTNGEYTITGLPAGEYTVTEDSGSAQVATYKLNVTYDKTDGKYTVEDDKTTTANVTNNYTPLGVVRVEKNVTGYDFTGSEQQQNRKDIVFRLYKINDDGSLGTKYGDKTYNDFYSNGYVNWTDVPVGKYALVEIAPDIEGYELTTTPNNTTTIGGAAWPKNTRSVQILQVTQGTTATANSTGAFTNNYKKKRAEIVLKKDFGANSKYTLDNWSEMSDDMLDKTVYEVHDNTTGNLVATYTLRQVLTAQAAGTPITYEATADHNYWFKEAPVLDAGLKVSVVYEWGVETLDQDGNVTGTATPFETKACNTDKTGYMSGVKKISADNRGTITFINTYEYDGEIKGDKTITGVLSEQEKAEVRDNLRFTIYQLTGNGEIVWKDNVTLAELEAGIKAPAGTYRVQESGSLQPNNSTNYIIITNSQVESNDRIVSSNTELFKVKKNSATTVHFYNDYGYAVGPGGKFGLIKYVRGLKEITGTEDIELKKGYTGDLGTVVDGLYDSIRFEIWKKVTVNGVEQEMPVGEFSLADFLAGVNLPVGSYRMKEKGGELTGYWWHAEFLAKTGIANYTKVGPTEWTFDITENGLPQIEVHNVYGKVGSLKITKDLINNTIWQAPNMAITVKGPLVDGVMPADPQINQTFTLSDLTMETGTGVNGNGYYTYTLDRLPIGTYEITETGYTDSNMDTWAKTTVSTVAGGSEQPQTIPTDKGGITGTVVVSETGTAVFGFKNQYDPDGAEMTLYKEFGAGNELDPDTMTDEQKRAIKFQLKENSVGKVLYEATFADFTKDAQGRWSYTFTGLEAYTYYLQEVIDRSVLPEAAWNWTAVYYNTYNQGISWNKGNQNVGCYKDNPGMAKVENTFKKAAQLQLQKVVDLPAGSEDDWKISSNRMKIKVEGPAATRDGNYKQEVWKKQIVVGSGWTAAAGQTDAGPFTSEIIPITEPGWYKITESVEQVQSGFSRDDTKDTSASVDGGAATVGRVTYIEILEEDLGSTTVHRVQYTNVYTQEAKLQLEKEFSGDESSLSMSNKSDKLQCFRITVRNEKGEKIKADGTVDNSIPYTLTVNDMSYGGGMFKKEIDHLAPGKYTVTETLVDTNGEILSEYTWTADALCNNASCKNGSESDETSLVTNKVDLKGNTITSVKINNNLKKLPEPEVRKTSSDSKVGEITDKNGVKYPVWRFTLDINNLYGGRNVKDGTFTMEDVFDTNGHSGWFRVATKAELQAAGLNDPYLNNSYSMVNKASGETHDPLTAAWKGNNIVVTGYKDGELYTKYQYTYYLVIKDEQSFIEFMKKDTAATTTLQRDFYNEISYLKNGFKPNDKTTTGAEYEFKNVVVYKALMNLDPDTGKLYIIDEATGDKIEVKRARYSVVLNANAETLGVSAAGTYPATLKASDTFSANQTVIPTSVKVTPSAGVSYVLDNDNHTIEFIIPNSTRVEIEYETTFSDGPAGVNPKLKNEMKLEGYGDGGEDEIKYSQEGGGGGTIYTVKILKHENGDQNNRLKGAVFGLYHGGGALETTVTTDEDGVATIRRWETGEKSLFADKNYYLQEIQQPTGYQLSATKYPFRFESSAPGYPMILPGDVVLAPNTPEVTGVSGQKTWSDNNNANGNRPTSITVQLSAVLKSDHTTAVPLTGNLTSISLLTVTQGTDNTWDYQDAVSKINSKQTPTPTVTNRSDDEWHYAWTNLPTYLPDEDDKQVEVEYKITEEVPDGYKATYNGNDILNTEGKVDVGGKKTWGDDDTAPANRTAATKVKVTIKAVYTDDDGNEVNVTQKALPTGVNATIEAVSPDYEYKWEDLPAYVDGHKVTYSVSEEEIPGYTGSKGIGEYDIHNAPNTVKLDGEKVWNETTDNYKNRPTQITVNLKAKDEQGNDLTIPGTVTTQKTVKKDVNGDWKWSFTGLPEYIGGKKAVYYVEELSVPGYDVSYNTVGDKVTVTNTPKKTNVKGTKTWNTGSVQATIPSRIYVTISAKIGGVAATKDELKALLGNQGETQVVTPVNNVWSYEWTDLPTHYNTKAVTYSVKETPVTGFTSKKGTGAYDIINTPDTGEISGSKTWSDNDNAWENRPEKIIITLKAKDDEGNTLTLPSGIDNPKEVKPDSNGNWEWNWGQLPKYIGEEKAIYYVEETAVPGYNKTETGMDVENTPATTEVKGTKTWAAGSNKYNQQPTSITVTISAKIGGTAATAAELAVLLGSQTASKTVSSPWTYEWTNLPTYYKKQQVTYSVTETPITGYTASKGTGDYDIENTPEYVTLNGSKTWNDSNNALKNRPAQIVITLKAKDNKGNALILPSGIDNTKTVTDDGSGKWAWTWEDLPKYIGDKEAEYYVEETLPAGYTKTESGMNVTNTPATTEVKGTKTWAAGSNKYGQQPTSIKVTISAKIGSDDATAAELAVLLGSQTAGQTVSSPWTYEWTNLPTHYNKQAVTYTVTETVPAGYTVSKGTGDYDLVNTPQYVDKDGAKTWTADPKNELGNWPAKIKVTLQAKNSAGTALVIPSGITKDQETTAAKDWAWSWKDLPKFLPDNSGTYYEAVYSVTETLPTGYTKAENGMNVSNTPTYTQVNGEKTWNDSNNKWKNRPTEITINLKAKNGSTDLTGLIPASINKEKKVSEKNGKWEWSWTNLPEYLGGEKVTYYVEETLPTGYTKAENGMNVTNTPETTEVPVTKNWNDNSNQYGTRPTEIKVNLIAKITKDGKAKDVTADIFGGAKQQTITGTAAAKTWSYTFTDLPKYYDGQLVDYSITEEAVQGYNGSVAGFTITNTPALISKSGEKTWSDNEDALGNRPSEITITLKAKNAAGKELTIPTDKVATQSKTVNKDDDNWKWTFSGLPISLADEDGTYYEAVYYVEETLPAGYTKTENGMNVTNTPATTTVKGTKTWAAGSEKVGIPQSIKVTISAETSKGKVSAADLKTLLGNQSAEKTVSGTAWTYEWTNLPTHFQGKEVTYSVTETPIAGFKASKGTGAYDIKNTPETDGKSGSKTWTADPKNEFGNWPTSITITLKAKDAEGNGLTIPQGIVNSKVVTADDDWSWSWTDLPKYIGDKEATYYVEETLPANSGYIKTDGVDMDVSNAPETVNKSGSKTWNDSDDAAGNRPAKITITLKAKDAQGKELTIPTTKIDTVKEVKPDTKGSWSWSWTDLPKYLQGKEATYYVEETVVTGYDKTENGMDVSNTPKTTKVDGKKTWNDSDNAMKNRPTSIWITLKAKDAEDKALTIPASITQKKEVKESDDWKWSWEGLPAYLQGKEATYYVEETAVTGYNKNEVGMNVENTPATTEVKGTKTWDDKTNSKYYGQQPTSITVTIKATTSEGDVTANVLGNKSASQQASSPKYEYSWTGLPTHYNGKAVTYSVTETPITGYTASKGTGTYDIVNTPEFVDVNGSKTWNDNNDALKNRPTEITVTLKARVKQADHKGAALTIPGGITTEQKVSEKNGKWEWSWKDLPKYIGEDEAEYYVVETLPTGYTKAEDGMDVTNTPATKDVTGVKTWNDQSNKYEQRPTAVKVTISAKIGTAEATADELKTLLGTQKASIEVKEGDDADNWSYGWTKLPTHYNKQEVTYTVTETVPAGYDAEYDGCSVKNTPQYVSVNGSKQWDDNNNENKNRPTEIKVTLSAKGKTSGDDLTLPTAITATQTVKPDTKGSWSWSWSELPKFISGEEAVYSVTEQTVTGYIASKGTGTYDIKNTPETCSAKVIKVWDDNENQDRARPAEIEVTLKNSLGETVANVTLPDNGNWYAQVDDLPVYKNGTKLTYTWYEDTTKLAAIEYTLTKTDKADLKDGDTVIGEVTTLTNSYKTKTTSKTVKKVWDDKNDQDGVRPTSLTVKLQVYNTETKQWEDTGKSVTLPDNGKWEATIDNLDLKKDGVEIKYRWSEESLPNGYTLANTEEVGTITTLTNKRETEKVAAKVVKEWNDDSDRDGKRPKQLVVELLADGKETGKTVTLEDGKWEATITGLEKNRAKADDTEKTVAIEYTWKEKNLPKDYTLTNTATANLMDGTTVIGKVTTLTNTHELEKTKVTVIKVWEDDKNRDGKRPASITVELKADGKSFSPAKTVTLDDNNQWTDSIDGLVKYREGEKGVLIEYTWEEGTVGNGYTLKTSSVDDTGYITTLTNKRDTEKVAAKVIKVWDDDDNRDNKRPASITVKLLADKVDTGKTVTLPKNGKWEDTITGLDKYKAGQVGVEIEYTWEEVLSSPYYKLDNTKTKVEDLKDNPTGNLSGNITVNGTINGTGTVIGKVTTLTNTHETLKVSAEVKKVWLDENNRDGKRPTSIEVELLADGQSMNPKKTVVLNAGNGWTQTVTDLPAYKTGAVGQAITYSWSEGTISNGYSLVTPIDPAVITKDQNGDVTKTTITLKNSRDTEKVDVEVYKLWEDDDNRDGLRPVSLTVELLADNQSFSPKKTVTLNAGNDWHGTVKGLDKYKAGAVGQLVKYTWREVNLPASYKLTKTETDTTGYITTLTNTHAPEKTTAEVKKVWKDAAAKDMVNKRPTEIKVELLMDGKSFSPAKIVTLKGNQWSYTEKDLLKYRDNGVEIKYTWVETAVPAGYILESNVTNAKVTTITNKATEVNVDKVDITGEKELPGAKLQILLEGKVVYEWTSTDKPHKISGLDTDVTYTLHEEVGPEGYKVTGDTDFRIGTDGKVQYNGITDTKGVLLVMDEPTSVKIKKVDVTDQHELEGAELWIYDSKGKAVTHWISEKTEKEIKNLKVDEDYTLVEKVPAPGYTVTTSTSFRIDKYGNVTYTGTTQQPSGILLVEDAPTETYVTKLDEDGYKLPGALLQVLNEDGTIAKDRYGKKLQWTTDGQTVKKIEGLVVGKKYILHEAKAPETYKQADDIVFTLNPDGTINAKGHVDKEGTLFMVDMLLRGSVKINKEFIFNFQPPTPPPPSPETVNIPVTKVWKDNNNKDGNRPIAIIVHLLADGQRVLTGTVTAADNWKYTFEGMPMKNADGKTIRYTVEEEPLFGYSSEITGSAKKGYRLVNTYVPATTQISVQKNWDDDNNKAGLRPDKLLVRLSTGKVVELNEKNRWRATVDGLPAFENGMPIRYSWVEESVPGYRQVGVLFLNNTYIFTNRLENPPEDIEEPPAPKGVDTLINHVGDCFD